MTGKETEEAVWKVYPEFPFIEANQFGEIRTTDRWVTCKNGRKMFVKGHVLKQWPNNKGYLLVRFSVNGKQVARLVHRIVAVSFLPNPDNLPEVNHKDNNKANNVVSNLEWCTSQYNHDYKNKFGTSPTQVQGRSVFAVDLKTGNIMKFESRNEAARQLNIGRRHLQNVIDGQLNQVSGYLFTEGESEITEEKIQEIRDKMYFVGGVIAIDLESLTVSYFDSQKEAGRKLNIPIQSINKVVKGKMFKTHGYWFCYADENAVEKVREKFGDEVANKVEELIHI